MLRRNLKKIVIVHDMTQTEREECRKLVVDAKAQEAKVKSGEYIYRVRGLPGRMKVVKIKTRQQLAASQQRVLKIQRIPILLQILVVVKLYIKMF